MSVAANGAEVRSRANGARSDIHDAQRGVDIHHTLTGNRQVVVERADHSRVVAYGHGGGYVQHPYAYHGHEFARRTYWENGRAHDRFYRSYGYNGVYYNVYAPYAYYPYGYYNWAYNPWGGPVVYGWGWGGAPWYGYYGGYYAPAPYYVSSTFWLADFMLAASLQAAYAARVVGESDFDPTQAPSMASRIALNIEDFLISRSSAAESAPPLLSPDVKAQLAEELSLALKQERDEAKANSENKESEGSGSGVFGLLSDGKAHVFLVGQDLDLVDAAGQECGVTPGDVIQVAEAPATDATTVKATVLASKGDKECAPSTTVSVTLNDLQEMHNHLRSSLDEGLAELKAKQGKNGLPSAPTDATAPAVPAGFVAAAPPSDPNAAGAIKAQLSQADQIEKETDGTASASASAPAAAKPQTLEEMQRALNQEVMSGSQK